MSVNADTLDFKVYALELWKAEGWNTPEAAQHLGVSIRRLKRWRRDESKIISEADVYVRRVCRGSGRKSTTMDVEPDIVEFIKTIQLEGKKLSKADIIAYCTSRFDCFKTKTPQAKYSWIKSFLKRHQLENVIVLSKLFIKRHPLEMKQRRLEQEAECAKPLKQEPDLKQDHRQATERKAIILSSDEEDAIPTKKVVLRKKLFDFQIVSFRRGETRWKLVMEEDDAARLKPKTWLNNTLLTYYIHKNIPQQETTYNFDCFLSAPLESNSLVADPFHPTVKAKTCEALCRTVSGFDWGKYRYVQIPICMRFHWSFLLVDNPMAIDGTTRFYHVDSIAGYHDTAKICALMLQFFAQEKMEKTGQPHSMQHEVKQVPTNPQQSNGYDCGIYVMYYMKQINQAIKDEGGITLERMQALCTGLNQRGCDRFRREYLSELIPKDNTIAIEI